MSLLSNLPVGGFVVIVIIGLLFILALLILFYTSARYRALAAHSDGDGEGKRGFLKVKLINVAVALVAGFACYWLGF